MRVDDIDDQFVERPFKLEVRYLSFLEVQPGSGDLIRGVCRTRGQHWCLRWRFATAECLGVWFHRCAQRHLTG